MSSPSLVRLDEIIAAARERMDKAPYSPHIVYAEIFFMTDAESIEFFELRREVINEYKNDPHLHPTRTKKHQTHCRSSGKD